MLNQKSKYGSTDVAGGLCSICCRYVFQLLLILFVTGCASGPTFKVELNERTNFAEVTAMLEKARAQSPGDQSIPLTLSQVYAKAGEIALNKAEARQAEDLRPLIEHYSVAKTNIDKSIAVLRPILDRPSDGPGFMDKMKKMTDSKYLTMREQLENQLALVKKLKSRIGDDKLQALKDNLARILEETTRLLGVSGNQPDVAYDEFVKYFPFTPYLDEVREAKLNIEQNLIAHLEAVAFAQTEKGDYADAGKTLERLAAVTGGERRAQAGSHAVSSHKAYAGKDYESAFDSLLAIRTVYPASIYYANYFDKTQAALIEALFIKIDTLMAEGKLQPYFEAFDRMVRLESVAEGNKAVKERLEQNRSRLRPMVAALLIQRVDDLKKQDMNLYSSLIVRNLRLAKKFDPAQVEKLEEDAGKSQGMTARKGEMRVLLNLQGSSTNEQAWAHRLEGDLSGALENARIPNLELVDKNRAKDGESVPGIVDVQLNGMLDTVEFIERGRDSPRSKSSKYISGTRQVQNPDYDTNKRAYYDAEATYRSLYATQQRLIRECSNLNGYLAQSICKAGISYVSSHSKDSAYAKWQSTPEYLTQNVISSYQYNHFTVSINGRISGRLTVLDNLNRMETKCNPVSEKFKREGIIITNTQPTDTEGVRDTNQAPDMASEQDAVYSMVLKKLSDEVVRLVSEQRAERYCRLGDKLNQTADKLKAMEAYSMCTLLLDDSQSKRRSEVESKLNQFMQVTPEQAASYGLGNNDEESAWPAAVDVDDGEMKLVMLKFDGSR